MIPSRRLTVASVVTTTPSRQCTPLEASLGRACTATTEPADCATASASCSEREAREPDGADMGAAFATSDSEPVRRVGRSRGRRIRRTARSARRRLLRGGNEDPQRAGPAAVDQRRPELGHFAVECHADGGVLELDGGLVEQEGVELAGAARSGPAGSGAPARPDFGVRMRSSGRSRARRGRVSPGSRPGGPPCGSRCCPRRRMACAAAVARRSPPVAPPRTDGAAARRAWPTARRATCPGPRVP